MKCKGAQKNTKHDPGVSFSRRGCFFSLAAVLLGPVNSSSTSSCTPRCMSRAARAHLPLRNPSPAGMLYFL